MSSKGATNHFYNWEIRGRGYSLFSSPVQLEPVFSPFIPKYSDTPEYVDDGKTPSLFRRLFSNKKLVLNEKMDSVEEFAYPYEFKQPLYKLSIHFSEIPDNKNNNVDEFLNMLSESEGNLSFEIVAIHNCIEFNIVCNSEDNLRVKNLIHAYFPNSITKEIPVKYFPFNELKSVVIVDFGYDEEFMRPISSTPNGLVSIMTVLENLKGKELVIFQIIFKGVLNPWAESIMKSVGSSKNNFFDDSPEMIDCVKEKISSPLFAVILRLAVQSSDRGKTEKLASELISNIKLASKSPYNSIVPLSNLGYEYIAHRENLNLRSSNRPGMLMNSKELSLFANFTNSTYLTSRDSKTREAPHITDDNDYSIGVNIHNSIRKNVTINDNQRLRHCHIIGATGTGKSTLITTLFLEDIRRGNGCVIFDPHGDTIDDIIARIPKKRLKDVILIDPSDSEYSIGLNLLCAHSEIEKIVLSSDLLEAFKRQSTSWGDQMTSVLSNAINAFLYSKRQGTLLELKRFLLEPSFRKGFLKSVEDKNIRYYWENDFNLLKRSSLSPLLTRLDTFLRPKTIRNMLSQEQGLDFNEVINGRKILLVKLSQGLIGEENSYLLGTLILSKIYQVALTRQSIKKEERIPFYIYLDEFQNFITPSISAILSGARKYGIGLILAHQDLNQIKDSDICSSVLSNANIRICFRLGDNDAQKLESGFSHFDRSDLQNLNIGDAIMRIGKNTDDFTLKTSDLKQIEANNNIQIITDNTREKYSRKASEIEEDQNFQLPGQAVSLEVFKEEKIPKNILIPEEKSEIEIQEKSLEYLIGFKEKTEIREHRYLQTFIKKIAEQRGFKANIEETVFDGRVDVSLTRDTIKIGCEIAVSNSVDYEVKNIEKCKKANYPIICVISKDQKHLERIHVKMQGEIDQNDGVHFFTPSQMTEFLDTFIGGNIEEKRIRGYRVKVNYSAVNQSELDTINQELTENTLRKK